jgi:hypothetical protein
VKVALLTLGYDQKLWDSKADVFTDTLHWTDMTAEEQMSASVLGYDQATWDAKVERATQKINLDHSTGSGLGVWTADGGAITSSANTAEASSSPSSSSGETGTGTASERPSYLDMDWVQLPELQRTAATKLGYEEAVWNNDEAVSARYQSWSQLTFELREAAKTLGYRQTYWNTRVLEPPEVDTLSEVVPSDEEEEENDGDGDVVDADDADDEAADADGAEDEAEEADGIGTAVIDVSRGRHPGKRANDEPEIGRLESEMEILRNELSSVRNILKQHEQVLEALQGMDPDATVGSVQNLISMGEPE